MNVEVGVVALINQELLDSRAAIARIKTETQLWRSLCDRRVGNKS
jgi:hypothetical protein